MELFKLFGTIAINNSGANDEIDETTSRAESAGNKISGAFKKVGSAAVKIGTVAAGAVSAVATGIGAMAKQSMSAYKDYEQLFGGIQTLFGAGGKSIEDYAKSVGKSVDEVSEEYNTLMSAQEKMMEQAKSAYMTAGLSMNEYMDTATSFAAALTSSCKNTLEAAEIADVAISDMSDNANKMGSSMESIQNAYQGFSKQNYTMLDNLKLGYGGTKSEMERLIADANELRKAQGLNADLTIEKYSDVIMAIHEIQVEMGIYKTTSEEAASTIQGSIGMMKGAWENFIGGMADPEQDFGELLNHLVDSVVIVSRNIAPRLIETIPRLVEGLEQLIEALIPQIEPLIQELLPALVKGSVKLLIGLAKKLPSIVKTLYATLKTSFGTLFESVFNELPNGMKEGISKIVDFFKPIGDNWQSITEGMQNAFNDLWSICQGIWDSVGQPIFDALSEVFAYLQEHSGEIFEGIGTAFSACWEVVMTVWNTIGQPIFDLIGETIDILVQWWNDNFDEISEKTSEVFSGIATFWEEHLKPCFEAIGNWLETVFIPLFKFVFEEGILPMVKKAFDGIERLWNSTLKPILTGIIDFITGVFSSDWDKAFEGLMNIAKGLLNGLEEIFMIPFDAAKNIVNNAIEAIKGFFDFEWSLPPLKLPHFSIQGEFSLNPPQVPHLGIDWYAKAMNDPMVMNTPTIFGYNPMTGQAMAGGEAGSEVVSGTDTLMNMISSAVESNNSGIVEAINRLIEFLQKYIPGLANMRVVLDSGVLVGELTPAIDTELGNIYGKNERWTS